MHLYITIHRHCRIKTKSSLASHLFFPLPPVYVIIKFKSFAKSKLFFPFPSLESLKISFQNHNLAMLLPNSISAPPSPLQLTFYRASGVISLIALIMSQAFQWLPTSQRIKCELQTYSIQGHLVSDPVYPLSKTALPAWDYLLLSVLFPIPSQL